MHRPHFPRILVVALCVVALLAVGWSILHNVGAVQAQTTSPAVPKFQMLSGTFADQALPEDGSTVTLLSLSFTTTKNSAMLQATSLIDGQFGVGGCCGQGGPTVTETCHLVLDSTPFFTTTWTSNSSLPASLSMTATDTITKAGPHTLSVQCIGSASGSGAETVLARSGGTSILVIN